MLYQELEEQSQTSGGSDDHDQDSGDGIVNIGRQKIPAGIAGIEFWAQHHASVAGFSRPKSSMEINGLAKLPYSPVKDDQDTAKKLPNQENLSSY